MNTVDVTDANIISSLESSSKGNQPKWRIGNKWYKADSMGYEGLSESVISELLKKTNVENFVVYEPVKIINGGAEASGCYATDFKSENESIITLEHLFRAYTGYSFAVHLATLGNAKDRIRYTVDFIEKHTNLKNAGRYITLMTELDALFLNEDRHTNNIAFIRNDNTGDFKYCPFFDFGLSILSDMNDYPINEDVNGLIKKVRAKPFDTDFNEQVDAAEELYGVQLETYYSNKDIYDCFDRVRDYYSNEIIRRAENVIFQQRRKYQYIIK